MKYFEKFAGIEKGLVIKLIQQAVFDLAYVFKLGEEYGIFQTRRSSL